MSIVAMTEHVVVDAFGMGAFFQAIGAMLAMIGISKLIWRRKP